MVGNAHMSHAAGCATNVQAVALMGCMKSQIPMPAAAHLKAPGLSSVDVVALLPGRMPRSLAHFLMPL